MTDALEKCRDRYFSFIEKSEGCWRFTGATDKHGYGRFWFDGQMRLSHHISWLLAGNEAVPALRHKCNNPVCSNPGHLLPGTQADNMRDVALAGYHSNRKCDPDAAIELRRKGWSLQSIGDHFGVSKQAARAAIIRHTGYKAQNDRTN